MKCVLLLTLLYGVLGVPLEDEALQEFVAGNHKFTASVYKELFKNQQGNFVVSPLSAEVVLALTNEAARGETAAELTTGPSLPSTKENTQKAIKSILLNLKRSDRRFKIFTASKIYTDKSLKLEDDFKTIASTIYDSGVESVNFANKEKSSATMNDWVEDKTSHKIKSLIKPDDIQDNTKAILVNALYFSAKWTSPFNNYTTNKKKFFKTKDDSVNVDILSQVEYFNYYESPTLNVKFLELPFDGIDMQMVIVLPNEKEGLKSVEQNIEQLLAPQPLKNERVHVEFPSFTIETKIKFIPILKNLGISRLFDNADLTGLSSNFKELYVSDVIQKVFVKFTESGRARERERSADGCTIFHADHPFIYLVKSHGVVLFVGRYTSP
ncbi:antichymotrypsin-2-like [Anoplophora glabripennis]|uniref:antichymotrypsin-2-like n=1 Tax=Anoplophora glabripennis TaxID=217634 RepID=UPI0008735A7D|nr:antichymotrypsin-2-like [Anoplophora glabripennis]